MEINIINAIGTCAEFVQGGKKQEISVVISPIRITGDEGALKITNGCNMWKACENKNCQFAMVNFPKKKE